MTWFRLDDGGTFHPKILAIGNEVWGAICRAGQWCAKHLTDGIIPKQVAHAIAPRRVWKRAVEGGFLVENGQKNYRIRDYLQWNISADEIRRERQRKAKNIRDFRGRRNRLQEVDVTGYSTGDVTGSVAGVQPRSISISIQERSVSLEKTLEPVCIPVPENEKTNGASAPSVHTGPRLDAETQVVANRIRHWPIFRELPADRIAYDHSGYMQSKGQKLSWVCDSIDACAATVADGTTLQKKQSMLVTYLRNARRPRETNGADDSRESAAYRPPVEPDPAEQELVRKAAQERLARAARAKAEREAIEAKAKGDK